MMRYILPAIILFLVITSPAAAAGGITNYHTQITYSQPITLPYTFEAFELTDAGAEQLSVELWSVDMINQIGSIALTLYSILSQFKIVGIFMVVLLALLIMFWLWRLVTDQPTSKSISLFDAADTSIDVYAAVTGEQNRARDFRKVSSSLKRLRRRR